MFESGQYIQLVLKVSVSLLVTSFLAILLTFLYLDPLLYGWSIWVLASFGLILIFSVLMLMQYLFRFATKQEIIFRETVDEFILTSGFASSVILLVIFLIYLGQLNLITFSLCLVGIISYSIFRLLG
jgi:hypothetical protein